MEPDVEVTSGAERGAGTQRPRPSLMVRGLEIAGLVLVGYGLASSAFLLAGAGVGLILLSYGIYRRKHGYGSGVGSSGFDGDSDPGGGGD